MKKIRYVLNHLKDEHRVESDGLIPDYVFDDVLETYNAQDLEDEVIQEIEWAGFHRNNDREGFFKPTANA